MDSRAQQLPMEVTELNREAVFAPRAPELVPESVHLWTFPLTIENGSLESYTASLSDDERARASRFRFERDARRFTVARASVRSILGHYAGARAGEIRFQYSGHGKPALADAGTIRFSVSHSGEVALLALAHDREVGVDLEEIRERVEIDQLAGRYFSEHERAALSELPREQRIRAFFRCWTCKEAFLKAQGFGLSRSLASFDVEVNPNHPARLLATRPDSAEALQWSLHDVPMERAFVAALAVQGTIAQLKLLDCR